MSVDAYLVISVVCAWVWVAVLYVRLRHLERWVGSWGTEVQAERAPDIEAFFEEPPHEPPHEFEPPSPYDGPPYGHMDLPPHIEALNEEPLHGPAYEPAYVEPAYEPAQDAPPMHALTVLGGRIDIDRELSAADIFAALRERRSSD